MSRVASSAEATYLGSVQDVRGAVVSVALDSTTLSGLSFLHGTGYRVGQIGSFVRIPMGFLDLYGVVSQIGAGSVPERLAEAEPHGHRWMTIQLIGEGSRSGGFARGLAQYPVIGDSVHIVTEDDLASIYGRRTDAAQVEIGRLASAESVPALIDIDRLVTRHSAIVGATGAGKSTLVAGLIHAMSDATRWPASRIVILDVHGEYSTTFGTNARVFRVSTEVGEDDRALALPYWALSFDELVALTMGSLDDPSHGAVRERVVELKRQALAVVHQDGVDERSLTADTPVPFSIHRLWFELHELVNATHSVAGTGQSPETRTYLLDENDNPVDLGDALEVRPPRYRPQVAANIFLSGSTLNIRRQLEALASRLRDPRYDFIFRPGAWSPDLEGRTEKNLDELLADWLGADRRVVVLDLSGIPASVLVQLVGALLRVLYDAVFWGRNVPEGGRARPVLVVLEEAHAYIGEGVSHAAGAAIRRIVKEGRKYGMSAMVVSQRPAEIDQTILSQCGTIFSMRLSNSTDRAHVTGSVSDNLEGLLNMLPVLRTGEAIVVGEAVRLPVRLVTEPRADGVPDSRDPLVYDRMEERGWNQTDIEADYARLARAWRSQDPGVAPVEDVE